VNQGIFLLAFAVGFLQLPLVQPHITLLLEEASLLRRHAQVVTVDAPEGAGYLFSAVWYYHVAFGISD